MDNVTFHHSHIITDIFKNSTNKLLFIPPYSPDFNPIEQYFSQVNLNNQKNILLEIEKSFYVVSPNNLKNYYKYSFIDKPFMN